MVNDRQINGLNAPQLASDGNGFFGNGQYIMPTVVVVKPVGSLRLLCQNFLQFNNLKKLIAIDDFCHVQSISGQNRLPTLPRSEVRGSQLQKNTQRDQQQSCTHNNCHWII